MSDFETEPVNKPPRVMEKVKRKMSEKQKEVLRKAREKKLELSRQRKLEKAKKLVEQETSKPKPEPQHQSEPQPQQYQEPQQDEYIDEVEAEDFEVQDKKPAPRPTRPTKQRSLDHSFPPEMDYNAMMQRMADLEEQVKASERKPKKPRRKIIMEDDMSDDYDSETETEEIIVKKRRPKKSRGRKPVKETYPYDDYDEVHGQNPAPTYDPYSRLRGSFFGDY